MSGDIAIHWFRQDLRLSDNPALAAAAAHDAVMPVYILDESGAGAYAMGAAARWWLHYSLQSLNDSLDGKLSLYVGDTLEIISALTVRYPVRAVYWNRCYEPWRIQCDGDIERMLADKDLCVQSYNGSLLWEPWEVLKKDGSPYKVFTPFYRRGCLSADAPREPSDPPSTLRLYPHKGGARSLRALHLLPAKSWARKLESCWEIGEKSAHAKLERFMEEGLREYQEGRDFPAQPYVSRLSPHLHCGEISPNQVWYTLRAAAMDKNVDHFCSELGWREFAYSQLYYHPDLSSRNLQARFDGFPWREDAAALDAWRKGCTGVPMVDAGMRELWQTGYMHNRVRMIVGSFLVKNLLLHWRHGAEWFWDTLVDADLANNSAGWQWVAGCGADAAPYFRIFNPVIQGKKFDPQGIYLRRFLPELALLPDRYLYSPWEAPERVLKEAEVRLGVTYPEPVVDLKVSRAQALAALASLRQVDGAAQGGSGYGGGRRMRTL